MKSGIEMIAQERQEQIEKHGFSLELDAEYYQQKELVIAASYCLMLAEYPGYKNKNVFWPNGWGKNWEHKILNKSIVGKLTVAGALFMAENDRRGDSLHKEAIEGIAAEIDRLQATEGKQEGGVHE